MPKLHLINSHLGGMGKSLFSRVLLHLHGVLNIPVVAFDADFQTYNLYRCYPQITHQIKFSNAHPTKTDGIVSALETGQSVVVNLASNSGTAISDWLERDSIFEVLEELSEQNSLYRYELVNWFLSDGTAVSLAEFLSCVETYGKEMTQVLVQNLGRSQPGDWEKSIDDPALVQASQQTRVYRVALPRFYEPDGFNNFHCSFAEVLEREELNLLDLQRVETFLEECQQMIAQSGFFLVDPFQKQQPQDLFSDNAQFSQYET
ncbi:hypothetical protein [Leptolyngbya sp. AN10]|uniref:hypothetical protein n=1 Tax=Leptolyngbya sp. AN10 TaxID=3423365 RepID=UPI003D31F009